MQCLKFESSRQWRPCRNSLYSMLAGIVNQYRLSDGLFSQSQQFGIWVFATSNCDEEMNLVLPVPDLFEEVLHVDALLLHVHHPRMIQHPPRRCTSLGRSLKTID